MRKRYLFAIMLLLLVPFFYYQNNNLVTTEYTIFTDKVTDTVKIVHLSDLHGKSFGKDQQKIIDRINEAVPDFIVFTGDLIDSRKYEQENSLLLMERLVKIAPVYYVTGNHEWRSRQFSSLESKLQEIGVIVLRDTIKSIKVNGTNLSITGIDDPEKPVNPLEESFEKVIVKLGEDVQQRNSFNLLLSHRPEKFQLYSSYNFDLVLSGHAHGGQIRLPSVGGLIAPNQGFFPKYDSGDFTESNTTMIVSRGLGNSLFPLRLFNRPEVVVIIIEEK